MTRRRFVVACCVLLAAVPMLAQSRGAKNAKPDPISGTWTGELSPQNESRRIPVTMELKLDGKGSVSGTVSGLPNPADVKAGTFDPKTGALKLQLGKAGESAVLLILEGTVVKGTASGRVSGDGGNGDFKIAKKV
jgi:hypothetical protein